MSEMLYPTLMAERIAQRTHAPAGQIFCQGFPVSGIPLSGIPYNGTMQLRTESESIGNANSNWSPLSFIVSCARVGGGRIAILSHTAYSAKTRLERRIQDDGRTGSADGTIRHCRPGIRAVSIPAGWEFRLHVRYPKHDQAGCADQ